jgi:dihydroxyacid dehydratase/phosphogluconate dehydratase
MTDGMRKGLTAYGDPGFSLFLRKAGPISAPGVSEAGDTVSLDVPARRIELHVDAAEPARRRDQAVATSRPGAAPVPERGYAAVFQRSVLQADEGCNFDFLVPGRAPRRSCDESS